MLWASQVATRHGQRPQAARLWRQGRPRMGAGNAGDSCCSRRWASRRASIAAAAPASRAIAPSTRRACPAAIPKAISKASRRSMPTPPSSSEPSRQARAERVRETGAGHRDGVRGVKFIEAAIASHKTTAHGRRSLREDCDADCISVLLTAPRFWLPACDSKPARNAASARCRSRQPAAPSRPQHADRRGTGAGLEAALQRDRPRRLEGLQEGCAGRGLGGRGWRRSR